MTTEEPDRNSWTTLQESALLEMARVKRGLSLRHPDRRGAACCARLVVRHGWAGQALPLHY